MPCSIIPAKVCGGKGDVSGMVVVGGWSADDVLLVIVIQRRLLDVVVRLDDVMTGFVTPNADVDGTTSNKIKHAINTTRCNMMMLNNNNNKLFVCRSK